MVSRWGICLAGVGAFLAIMMSGCGGTGPKGASSPSELAQQVVATCAGVSDPEVSDFDALFPDAALLNRIPFRESGGDSVRQDADPAKDVQRIRDAWQVILDMLTTEDALQGLRVAGQPTPSKSAGGVSKAYITLSFGQSAATFRIAAAELRGRWYIVDARLDEATSSPVY